MLDIKKIIDSILNRKLRDYLNFKDNHHFGYLDYTKSITAKKYKIDNHPKNAEILHNIGHTNYRITTILEDLLQFFNKTWSDVKINSWFRCPRLNKKVDGSKTSDHKKGKAVDFGIKGVSTKEICDFIHKKYYAYDQLISYPEKKFTHISFDPLPFLERNENKIYTKKDGYKKVEDFS